MIYLIGKGVALIKKTLLFLMISIGLVSCDDSNELMKCGDFEIFASVEQDFLLAIINGDKAVLDKTASSSGVRYAGVLNDTAVIMWNQGQKWSLILNNDDPIECK